MAAKSAASANIRNRSPWLVQVRSHPELDQRFSFPQRAKAQRYCDSLVTKGLKPKLTQLETSFELRVRRQGVKTQFITFDTWQLAEQARLQIEANLSADYLGWHPVGKWQRGGDSVNRV